MCIRDRFKFDWQEKVDEIRDAIDKVKKAYEEGDRPVSASAPRILITGCPMGGVTEKVVKVIEDSGAVVVAFENCTGAKDVYKRQLCRMLYCFTIPEQNSCQRKTKRVKI